MENCTECGAPLMRTPRKWYRNGVDHRPGIIYVLRCPKTNRVRYVGKTGKTLKHRFASHLREAKKPPRKSRNRPVLSWIRKLGREGLKPKAEVLQECLPGMLNASEQEWIAQYRADGIRLLNVTEGGDATAWSEDAKQRQSERCLKINRRLAKDPKWLEAQHRRRAANRGMTLEQYREKKQEQADQHVWNRLLDKYYRVFARIKGNYKQRCRKGPTKEVRQIRIEGDIAYVPLTQGQMAIIDAEDVPKVSRWRWAAQKHHGKWRAKRSVHGGNENTGIELLAWRIAGKQGGQAVRIINGNPLDCRKRNLDVTTIGQREDEAIVLWNRLLWKYNMVIHRVREDRRQSKLTRRKEWVTDGELAQQAQAEYGQCVA